MWRWATGALAALVFVNAAQLQAAEFKVETQNGKTRIVLTGKIERGDADKFAALLKSAQDKGAPVSLLELSSPGGAGLDGVKMADLVRQSKITTSVPERAICASACFIIFAGGTERRAHQAAHLGVHGAADAKGQETAASSIATLIIARKLSELNVPSAIIGKMVVTLPRSMIWIGASDLRDMDVKVVRGVSASPLMAAATAYRTAAAQGQAQAASASAAQVEAKAAFDRRDYAAVERLLKPLAENGDSGAQVMMGAARERSLPRDEFEAMTWYRRAADQGHPYALYMLGHYYAKGNAGLVNDRITAYAMVTLARENGSKIAADYLTELEKEMISKDIAEAKRRVSQWRREGKADLRKLEAGAP